MTFEFLTLADQLNYLWLFTMSFLVGVLVGRL
jgi:hypothetical protein